jgi:hypothetical protein
MNQLRMALTDDTGRSITNLIILRLGYLRGVISDVYSLGHNAPQPAALQFGDQLPSVQGW